ncbi:hypothetical protein CA13_29900 [Planctomycetes bacterium CA13]|uniref:Alpha-L-fucosidase C-terminal domain-containing protein n=1 Tax=Novipirellula herctigrandis TaxID=2527986 RepID=A0A5C5Z3K3_9BACT|nr:hypothetical protein CA13_29900 [Planctomycetes bacterium CA13]
MRICRADAISLVRNVCNRYKTKGEYLYAYVLAWPPKKRPEVELTFLASGNTRIGKIESVEMLGRDGDVQWEHHRDGFRVTCSTSITLTSFVSIYSTRENLEKL